MVDITWYNYGVYKPMTINEDYPPNIYIDVEKPWTSPPFADCFPRVSPYKYAIIYVFHIFFVYLQGTYSLSNWYPLFFATRGGQE
jgi:hypothetical protein